MKCLQKVDRKCPLRKTPVQQDSYLFLIGGFLIYYLFIFKRATETVKGLAIHWFMPQMPTTSRAEAKSLELCQDLPHGWQGSGT